MSVTFADGKVRQVPHNLVLLVGELEVMMREGAGHEEEEEGFEDEEEGGD